MTKSSITAAVSAVSLAVATLASGAAQAAQPGFDTTLARPGDAQLILAASHCFRGERSADCRERLRVEQRSNRHYVYRDGRYQDNSGAAIAGGILGFVLGAAIAGSQQDHDYYYSHRNDRGWRERCQQSYHDFDYRTGTYVGGDGYRHYCTR
jgi:hypothetical protein